MKKVFRIGAMALAAMLLAAAMPATSLLSFKGGGAWLNSGPVTRADLKGKVVLVDFWEYTCINCLRTLPYLRTWYQRYHDDGFTIVGVQTPEFGFSGEPKNVEAGVKRLGITWPVVVDDSRAIWNRYHITEWPTELLYNQEGQLVAGHLGEGDYPQTEAKIQSLLLAANPHLALPPVMQLLPQDSYDKPGAVCYPQTPEILIEMTKIADASAFDNPYQDTDYRNVGHDQDGKVYLNGYWHATKEAFVSGGGGGYIEVPYHAIQVDVVMTTQNRPTHVMVTEDGKPVPREDAGPDLHYAPNGTSYVMVDASRSYHLITNKAFGYHDLRLYPSQYGLGVYDFAFESCEVPATK
jgi:thiol-disulfide isomerase/thioredoxin